MKREPSDPPDQGQPLQSHRRIACTYQFLLSGIFLLHTHIYGGDGNVLLGI